MNTNIERLLSLLAIKRCHDSAGEAYAVERFLSPYNPTEYLDPLGTVLAYVITTDPNSTTLFSCHVDSVHAVNAPIENKVVYDANMMIAYKDKDDLTPLGADDAAGWWLMLEMIDQNIPGTYLFHRGEEKGGIGSSGMSLHYHDFLKRFKRAVAFDRRGTTSVITHQGMGECCSDEFAQALSDQFNAINHTFLFEPDDTGIYTDTAEYTHLIPECTNISCGYQGEHTPSETLDVEFLVALCEACIYVDWESLPVVREAARPSLSRYDTYMGGGYGASLPSKGKKKKGRKAYPTDEWDLQKWGWRDLTKWCKSDPEGAADLILTLADQLVEMQTRASDEAQTPLPSDWDYPASVTQTFNDF
jgi:hypothetical protein